jgi:uracil-DNA glycosylase family 4
MLDWWQIAGVDVTVDDTPRQWLRAAQAPTPVAEALPAEAAVKTYPNTLEALSNWLISPDNLPELGSVRIAPSGSVAGGLMIMSDMPDKDDLTSGLLLAGSAGRLLDGMLGAIGRDRAAIYLTALAPGRPPTGKISATLEKELGEIARNHIALAKPRAVLMIGDATIRALTGMGLASARRRIHDINLATGNVPAIATFHPRFLLQQPTFKADVWADLRMLMEILTK